MGRASGRKQQARIKRAQDALPPQAPGHQGMEWPSARIDTWFLGLFAVGVGLLAVPDTITLHQLRYAIFFWSLAILLFICGFPAVQRRLHIVWGKCLVSYRLAVIVHPYSTRIAVGLGAVMVGVLLFKGGSWLLLEGGTPSSASLESEGEPVVRMEPEHEFVPLNEDNVFPLRFVNGGSDIDNISLMLDYFVAQRPSDGEVSIKRIYSETCELGSRLVRTNEGIPIRVKLGDSILRPYHQAADAFRSHGPSLLGLKVAVGFRRVSDRKDFKLRQAYGCEGLRERGKRCGLLTTERMNSVPLPPEAKHQMMQLQEVLPHIDNDEHWEGLAWTPIEGVKFLWKTDIHGLCNPEEMIFP